MAKPHIRIQRAEACIKVYVEGNPSKETWAMFMTLAAHLYQEPEKSSHTIRFRNIEVGVSSDSDWEELKSLLAAGERAWRAEQAAQPKEATT